MWKKENLRKNFLRVKQIADQNLGRAEKSEVLSEDLQSVEKRVELVKHVCQNTTKRLGASLQTTGGDVEKRLKKLPEANLAHCMVESANLLGPDTIMGLLFQLCGECQNLCAKEMLQYEIDVNVNVLNPLQDIIDKDVPQLAKLRKQLNKVTLDMDSAKSRLCSAVRQTQTHGTNVSASAKADIVKEEYEEALNRVEQAKDLLATELFIFVSREAEHSSKLLALLEAQCTYHKNALEAIEKLLPKMRSSLDTNQSKPLYGLALEEHLRVTDRDVALVIEACVCTLLEAGMEEEGLFRIAGMASKVKKLKASFDANIVDLEEFATDLHSVAGALKQYLRELPEPLLTFKLYSEFLKAAQVPPDQRLQALHDTVEKLPRPNYNNFRYLIKFLAKLTDKSDVNKMTPNNIGIVIGPNLLWSEGDCGPNMLTSGTVSSILETCVTHAGWFFPGEFDFHSTLRGAAPPPTVGEKSKDKPQEKESGRGSPPLPKIQSPVSQQSSVTKACSMTYNTVITPIIDHQSPATSHPEESDIFVEASSRQQIAIDKVEEDAGDVEDDRWGCSQGERKIRLGCGSVDSSTNKLNPGGKDGPTGIPRVQSRSLPPRAVAKSFHHDVYSTVFALQTLGGDGTDYLSKVRALWEGHNANHSGDSNIFGNNRGIMGGQRSYKFQELDFGSGSFSSQSSSPALSERPKSEYVVTERDTISFSSTRLQSQRDSLSDATPPSQAQSQTQVQENPSVPQTLNVAASHSSKVTSMSSPPPPPPSPGPGGDNYGQAANSFSLAPLAQSEQVSPKFQRRISKKPAPPPPLERPFNIAITASVAKSANLSQTWPRQAVGPLQQDEDNSGYTEVKKQHSPPSRPAVPPDKPVLNPDRTSGDRSTLPSINADDRSNGSPPERPKFPPPLAPQHQRSASMGAPVSAAPSNTLSADDKGSSSRTCSNDSLNKGVGMTLTNSNLPVTPDKSSNSNSINRQSSNARPARPTPPPPPPPVKIIEETHL